jgi:hypothetical protein
MFLYTPSLKYFILIVGTMPPRNPTTRRSPRAPKLKEPEVGEGSSPGAAKQLEFSPRPWNQSLKHPQRRFSLNLQPLETQRQAPGPKQYSHIGGNSSRRSTEEEFPEYVPHSDPDVRALDDEVFSEYLKIVPAHGSKKNSSVPLHRTPEVAH